MDLGQLLIIHFKLLDIFALQPLQGRMESLDLLLIDLVKLSHRPLLMIFLVPQITLMLLLLNLNLILQRSIRKQQTLLLHSQLIRLP